MAMAAGNNLANSKPGSVNPRMNATEAYQRSLMANEQLLMQKQQQKRRDAYEAQRARLTDAQIAGAERKLDPAADFRDLKAQGLIPETMTYEEYIQSGFAGRSANPKAFAPKFGKDKDGNAVMLTPTFDPATGRPDVSVTPLPEGFKKDENVVFRDMGDKVNAFSPDGVFLYSVDKGLPPASQPENVREVEEVKQDVKKEADLAEETRLNEKTYGSYQAGMQGLTEALGGTWTGTIGGLIPAVTASQQKADAAKSLMAPILKSLFRESGEGTFTDSDQRILMEMLPGRGDKPETVAFKLGMIDKIVRGKLGIPADTGKTFNIDGLPKD
jgi:hypothetical protein